MGQADSAGRQSTTLTRALWRGGPELANVFAGKREVSRRGLSRCRPRAGEAPFLPGRRPVVCSRQEEGTRLALAHLAEDGAHALLGLAGLTFLAALLALEALHRCQKPQRFWLAI